MSRPSTYSHQTVRLGAGKHHEPGEVVCVMELASMLAGEPFSDRPQSVCPVIGALLRTYNDSLDDERRQDLYAVATRVVGTRDTREVALARARRCVEVALDEHERMPRLRRLLYRSSRLQRNDPDTAPEAAAVSAVRALQAAGDRAHARVLALIDELAAMKPVWSGRLAWLPAPGAAAAGGYLKAP